MNHFFTSSHNIPFLLITISMLFLSACQNTGPHQAYEGPAKKDSEVATLTIPGQYNLLSIDGGHYQQNILRDGAVLKMLPGSHQLIIEYQDFWNPNGEQTEKITSKLIAITFTARAGNQYTISAAPLESVEQAQAFAEKPSISITDTINKQAVPAEIKYNLYGRGLFTALFEKSQPESTVSPVVAEKMSSPNKNGKALEMLKYWWESADKNQQGDFRQWLKSQ